MKWKRIQRLITEQMSGRRKRSSDPADPETVEFLSGGPILTRVHFDEVPLEGSWSGEAMASFSKDEMVVVNSKVHGPWVARVERVYKSHAGWRYQVSNESIRACFDTVGRVRSQDVDEEILSHYQTPKSPEQSMGVWAESPAFECSHVTPPEGAAKALEAWRERFDPLARVRERERVFEIVRSRGVPPDEIHWAEHALAADAQERTKILTTPLIKRRFLLAMIKAHEGAGNKYVAEILREDLVELWHEDLFPNMEIWEAMRMTQDEYDRWVAKDFQMKGE